jgi:hypothetical protein
VLIKIRRLKIGVYFLYFPGSCGSCQIHPSSNNVIQSSSSSIDRNPLGSLVSGRRYITTSATLYVHWFSTMRKKKRRRIYHFGLGGPTTKETGWELERRKLQFRIE